MHFFARREIVTTIIMLQHNARISIHVIVEWSTRGRDRCRARWLNETCTTKRLPTEETVRAVRARAREWTAAAIVLVDEERSREV